MFTSKTTTILVDDNCIKVYPFDRAPKELRERFGKGGDEDWIAIVPTSLKDEYIGWLESEAFGCCSIDKHIQLDGSTIYVGNHA